MKLNAYIFWIFLTSFLVSVQISNCRKMPSFVKICKSNEPGMNKCVTNSIKSMRDKLMEGIPQMGIRSLDPVKIDQLHLNYGQGTNSAFEVQLTNLAFRGVRDFQLNDINFDDVQSDKKEGINVAMKIFFPKMYLTADYDVNGHLLMLAFKSQGQFTGNFTSVTLDSSFVAKVVEREGLEYFEITGSKLTVDIQAMYLYLQNLFPGNADLTEQMNGQLNQNTDIIYDELKPLIEETIKAVIADSIASVYKLFPRNILFP